jgi:hypothetical protein
MNKLMKFIEQGAYGEKSGRTAYAFKSSSLPASGNGMQWQPVNSFNAGDELLRDAGLKDVFKIAVSQGCAVVTPGGND